MHVRASRQCANLLLSPSSARLRLPAHHQLPATLRYASLKAASRSGLTALDFHREQERVKEERAERKRLRREQVQATADAGKRSKSEPAAAPASSSVLQTSAAKAKDAVGGVLDRVREIVPRLGAKKDATPVVESKAGPTQTEQLDQIEQLMAASRMYTTADLWGTKMQTLDVHIPVFPSPRENATWQDNARQLKHNVWNWVMNAQSMWRLAKGNAVPTIDIKSPWSLRMFKSSSIAPDEWIAPIRAEALDTYYKVNKAIAEADLKALKKLTTASFYDRSLKLARTYDRKDRAFRWRSLGEQAPTAVVSIRVVEGYLGPDDPKLGSRLVVQALVKFNTNQVLEIFSSKGESVHKSQRHVVEYMVVERRMWYDAPWVIREQLYEGLEGKFESA